jgi:MFS transporter, ACS family, hexuronate transporter
MTRYRWFILALLFAATTNNYLDRIVFTVLIPVIRTDLHISNLQYGYISAVFQALYTLGFLFMGSMMDRWGTRFGYSLAIATWSIAATMHAVVRSALSLSVWRGFLGLSEAGNFPAGIKAVAEWFPKKDRALATGLFNSGTTVASIVGPPVFVWLASQYGWRACFLVTGGSGFVLVLLWWIFYRVPEMHRSVNQEELAYIRSDPESNVEDQPKISWAEAAKYKQTWGFGIAKGLTDPVWWFYLYWLPLYLVDKRGFDLTAMGWAIPIVYTMAGIGSVAGGWLSGLLMRRGWSNSSARKTAMGICAGLMPLGALSVFAPNPILVIIGVGIATGAHQGWSANLFTSTSDVFPKAAVGSVVGIGSAMGGLGGVIFSTLLPGFIITLFGYTPIFLIMGGMHLTALVIFQLLMGRMQPLSTQAPAASRG